MTIPVTVKCRIGIDEQDPEQALEMFAQAVEQAGVDALVVHARKAWLKGLSPKENREIPPLDYERVYRLKAAHPRLTVILNGGVGSVEEALAHLAPRRRRDDGPRRLSGAVAAPCRRSARVRRSSKLRVAKAAAAAALMPYIERELAQGTRLHAITRHLHGLFRAVPGRARFPPPSAERRGQSRMRARNTSLRRLHWSPDGVAGQRCELAHIAA